MNSCVTNHQFSSGKGLRAYSIAFVAMLYLDSAVLLTYAAWHTLYALCVFFCICCYFLFYMRRFLHVRCFLHAINSWCY